MSKTKAKTQAAPTVVSNTSVKAGRPKFSFKPEVAKKIEMLERHLQKRGGEFTPTEVTKSLALNLRGVNNPRLRVKQWMEVLVDMGKLKHVGFKQVGRGKAAKLFALADSE